MQISFVRSTMEYIPESSQRLEAPGLMGPGTMLTPYILSALSLPSITKAAVPYKNLRLPSLTATASPARMAAAIVLALSGIMQFLTAQVAEVGKRESCSYKVAGGGKGCGRGVALP